MIYVSAIHRGGFPENIGTYALISGLFTSLYSAGAFIGPSIGGVLTEHVSFCRASIFPLSVEIGVIALTISHYIRRKEQFLSITRSGYQTLE